MLRSDDLMNGLRIWQDPEKFCFGIDAVLLAHYPVMRKHDRILDMGCGFAPIPLIMYAAAKRSEDPPLTDLHFTGLELQADVAEVARKSVKDNGLSSEMDIVTGDIREAVTIFGAASFSLVTCNPPYKPVTSGLTAESTAKALARSEIACTLEDVLSAAEGLLAPRGRFAMIHRPERLVEILAGMRAHRIEPKRLRMVYPTEQSGASMVLIEGVRGGRPQLTAEPPLIIYNEDRSYTREVLTIYGGNSVSGGDAHRES